MTMSQLDDYSLLNIFDLLSIGELANVAQLSSRYYVLIMEHYVPKFGLKDANVYIALSEWEQYTYTQYSPAKPNSAAMKLSAGHNETFAALKVFCPLFSRVSIKLDYQFQFDDELTQRLAHLVNTHCPADAPQNINIYGARNSYLNFTFQRVTNVRLRHLESWQNVTLNGVFPRMDTLMIGTSRDVAIKEHFPHLKSFELYEFKCGLFDWKAFAAHNSELESIKLDLDWDTECMEQSIALFPKLKSLYVIMENRSASRRPRNPGAIVRRLVEMANLDVIVVLVDDPVSEMLTETFSQTTQWILSTDEVSGGVEMTFKRRKTHRHSLFAKFIK